MRLDRRTNAAEDQGRPAGSAANQRRPIEQRGAVGRKGCGMRRWWRNRRIVGQVDTRTGRDPGERRMDMVSVGSVVTMLRRVGAHRAGIGAPIPMTGAVVIVAMVMAMGMSICSC